MRALLLLFGIGLVACAPPTFYPDGQVDQDGDGVLPGDGDCDDTEAAVGPELAEICDGLDNDCDGLVDGADPDLRDDDSDGHDDCTDCDDADPTVHPDRDETCDGRDEDCDGVIPASELDADEDGVFPCEGDCDDGDPLRSPLLVEACDGADTDCDGLVDEPVAEALPQRVAVAGPGSDLRVWSRDELTLSSPEALGVPAPSGVVGPTLAVDLDGDGVRDWLRQQVDPADLGADEVISVSRTCDGGWTAARGEDVPLGGDSRLLAAGDLDGDGLGDVVTLTLDGVNAGRIGSYLGDGEGGWLARPSGLTLDLEPSRPRVAPTLVDLNGDDRPDLVSCTEEPEGPRCRMWSGQGDGSFLGGLVVAEAPVLPGGVDLADLDGDGTQDLVFGLGSGGAVLAVYNDGLGGFTPPETLLDVSADAGGEGVLRAWSGAAGPALALLWAPQPGTTDRALAVAALDGDAWVVGPEVTFSAAAAPPGADEALVTSP